MTGDDASHASRSGGLIVRMGEPAGDPVIFSVDGQAVTAFAGDSVLVAVLAERAALRLHEFDGGMRAGFCLMGACQDCWMWTVDGQRLRACTTPIRPGLALMTRPPRSAAAHA